MRDNAMILKQECYQISRHSMYAMISVIEIQCLALLMTNEEKSYDRILKFLLFDYLVKFNSLNKCNVIGIFPFPSSSDLTNNWNAFGATLQPIPVTSTYD